MALIEKLTDIADSLRFNLNTQEKYTLSGMVDGIYDVFDAGKAAAWQEFWEKVPNVTQKYMFAGPIWNVNTFYPEKSFAFSGQLTDYMFAGHGATLPAYDLAQRLTDCGVSLDFSKVTRAYHVFYGANLTRLPEIDFSGCTKLLLTFAQCASLTTIDRLVLSEKTTYEDVFLRCTALENLTVAGTIGKVGFDVTECPLSRESLLSILTALQDGVSGLTVTLGQSNLDKLTPEEKAIATDKGWILQ